MDRQEPAPALKRRRFGRMGWDVTEIGFGAWGIGGTWWGRTVDDKQSLEALRTAVDLGINFYDTAFVYGQGHSEQLIGKVLRENKHKKLYVASKIPPKNGRWPAGADTPLSEAFPADWIRRSVEKSLAGLRMEKIDLMQLHVWADRWTDEEEWKKTVEDLKREGKLAAFGVSINDHAPETALRLVASGAVDSVQVIFNIFDQSPREKLLPLCQKHDVAVIARVPFDEGSLTGTFTQDTAFEEGDFRREYFQGRMDEVLKRVAALSSWVRGDIQSLSEAALNFVLSFPEVSAVIPGMRKPAHVRQNVRAAGLGRFSDGQLQELRQHAWIRNFYD